MNEQRIGDTALNLPLVSVITPVYNGEKYLAECIESVLAQTYKHWEYVIVDNCSTDRSSEIAGRYAQRDGRIRVHQNRDFVSAIQNHHVGFGQMSRDARYCKVVHADDWIFPDCIRQMVELAEAHPRVGIVSAHSLEGDWVALGGLPSISSVVSGREACRLTLLRWAYLFGSPSALLLRAACVRERTMFYDEKHFPQHSDTAACLEVLQGWDFGFVRQILTYTRIHSEAQSSFSLKVNSYLAEGVAMLLKYGPLYLDRGELEEVLRQWTSRYRRFLVTSMLKRRDDRFWAYHKEILNTLGWSPSPVRWFATMVSDAVGATPARIVAARKRIAFRTHG